ncbi:MAG: DUF1464 family protein [Sulfolobales archaeon]
MRVLAIDPGTMSTAILLVEENRVEEYIEITSRELSRKPETLFEVIERKEPDIVVAPSGYGLPPVDIRDLSLEERLKSLLIREDDPGVEDLKYISFFLRNVSRVKVPVIGLPGVYNLATISNSKRINRIDLGTADKVATAILAAYIYTEGDIERLKNSNIIVLELGAFTAGVAISRGEIIDGIGGTLYPIGLVSGGGWDGEVTVYIARRIFKKDLFRGGLRDICRSTDLRDVYERCREAFDRYVEDIAKTIAMLEVSIRKRSSERIKIYLSGRGADKLIIESLEEYNYIAETLPSYFKNTKSHSEIKRSVEGAALYGLLWVNNRDFLRTLGVLREWISYTDRLLYYK